MKTVKLSLKMQLVKLPIRWILNRLKKKRQHLREKNQAKKVNRERQKNKKDIPFFDSCENLPAWRFFKVLKSSPTELRYLLDCDPRKLPEYFTELLIPVWDNILTEFDRLNNTATFTNAFRDIQADIEERGKLIILHSCYDLMQLYFQYVYIYVNTDQGFEFLKKNLEKVETIKKRTIEYLSNECGIIIKDIDQDSLRVVHSAILRFQTRLRIQAVQRDEEKGPVSQTDEYIQSVVQMSNILGRTIDAGKITTTEWVVTNNECRKIIKARKDYASGNKTQ